MSLHLSRDYTQNILTTYALVIQRINHSFGRLPVRKVEDWVLERLASEELAKAGGAWYR